MDPQVYHDMAAKEQMNWWFVGRRAILDDVLSRLKLGDDARLLEIGCGTGGNIELLSGYGRVDGVDVDESAVAMAGERAADKPCRIQKGNFPEDEPFPGESYDLICMFDVLEHIENDEQALATLRGRLRPNGHLLITVPAYQALWGLHDKILHHKRRYDLRGIRALFEHNGYAIDRLTCFNTLLFLPAALVRLMERRKRQGMPVGASGTPGWQNGILTKIFSAERYALRFLSFPFGLSILVLARPTEGGAAGEKIEKC